MGISRAGSNPVLGNDLYHGLPARASSCENNLPTKMNRTPRRLFYGFLLEESGSMVYVIADNLARVSVT